QIVPSPVNACAGTVTLLRFHFCDEDSGANYRNSQLDFLGNVSLVKLRETFKTVRIFENCPINPVGEDRLSSRQMNQSAADCLNGDAVGEMTFSELSHNVGIVGDDRVWNLQADSLSQLKLQQLVRSTTLAIQRIHPQ